MESSTPSARYDPAGPINLTAERKGVPMESSEQDRPMESGVGGGIKLDRAGDQNAGVINVLHVVFVLGIVALIVAYIVDKA
jgi:hypothetical protein